MPIATKPKINPPPAARHLPGQWVERRTKNEILLCSCGTKYLKTRKNQTMCVWCLYRRTR